MLEHLSCICLEDKGGLELNTKASFRMFTINEAAAYYCLPKHFIRKLVLEKEIPSIKAGKKYLICDKIIENYLKNGADCGTM